MGTADDTCTEADYQQTWLIFPLAYLSCHVLVLNETNADTSHIHTLCLVRRSWVSDVVHLASDVVYWPKEFLELGWTMAAKMVSPGFPDE